MKSGRFIAGLLSRRRGQVAALISILLLGFSRSQAQAQNEAPGEGRLSDQVIREIWTEIWKMMPEGTPPITPMADADLVKALAGEWICLMSSDPYARDGKIAFTFRPDHKAVISGIRGDVPWKEEVGYRTIDGKLAFPFAEEDEGGLPTFVFPCEGKFFIFDPFNEAMRSELLGKISSTNAAAIDSSRILDYYWSPESLETMGERALQHLTDVLRKPVEDGAHTHYQALTAIDLLRPPPEVVLPAMIDCLNRGVTPAALNVARLGGPDAVKPLVAALTNSSPEVRADAAWALAMMHPDEDGDLRIILNGDERVWTDFRSSAGVISPALVERLRDADATVRHRAAHALGQIGGDAARVVPALVDCLDDPHELVRQHAAESLGRFRVKEEPVPSALAELLDDSNAFVRWAAQQSLKKLGIPPTAPADPAGRPNR